VAGQVKLITKRTIQKLTKSNLTSRIKNVIGEKGRGRLLNQQKQAEKKGTGAWWATRMKTRLNGGNDLPAKGKEVRRKLQDNEKNGSIRKRDSNTWKCTANLMLMDRTEKKSPGAFGREPKPGKG